MLDYFGLANVVFLFYQDIVVSTRLPVSDSSILEKTITDYESLSRTLLNVQQWTQ